MGKNKLSKFAEMETYPHVFQVSSRKLRDGAVFELKGKWNELFFKNSNPIVLELGCGKGEYAVELAGRFPNINYIGVDIKGARMWTGAKKTSEMGLKNVAFLRADIEMINYFFETDEIAEIWLTFPDPQMKKVNKRLTSTNFMRMYQRFLVANGCIHLKTDSNFMYTYTCEMVKANHYPVIHSTNDLYAAQLPDPVLETKTFYEQQWLQRGLTIKYICFELEKRTEFIEPETEIERDAYRSFGRNANQQKQQTNDI